MKSLARTVLAVVATFACACARQASTAARSTPIQDGIYHFSERPSGSDLTIEGDFTVLADSVWIETAPQPCRYQQTGITSRVAPFIYTCGSVTLSFDRLDPVRKSTYRTTITVQQKVRTCARYETNPQGQRVCVQYQTETVEKQVPVSGILRAVRRSDIGS